MKTLVQALIVVAMVNLVLVGGFVGWLVMGDRLDSNRARTVRQLLTKTITQEKAEAEKAAKEWEAAKLQAEEEAKSRKIPLTAAEQLAARLEATELDRQRMERLRREVEDLQRSLAQERAGLEKDRTQLESDQKAFEAQVRVMAASSKDEQFRKTLGVLESLKPQAAKTLLTQIIKSDQQPAKAAPAAQGVPAGFAAANTPASLEAAPGTEETIGMRTAVEYLDAMDERVRSKLMGEVAKEDPALATRLLEALRQRGQFARVESQASNAPPP
jgi:hypothetical protein